MSDWGGRLKSKLRQATGRRPDVYEDLRSMALRLDPSTLELPDGAPMSGAYVALMEFGMAKGTASVVAVVDGSVSMYVSTGGGVIGVGGHAAVRGRAERFRTVAADSRGLLQRTEDFPLPEIGQVRFQVRTGDGDFSGAAPEAALSAGRHPLSPLYAAGQDLLTEIRLSTPQ